jgi:hypothetical protein
MSDELKERVDTLDGVVKGLFSDVATVEKLVTMVCGLVNKHIKEQHKTMKVVSHWDAKIDDAALKDARQGEIVRVNDRPKEEKPAEPDAVAAENKLLKVQNADLHRALNLEKTARGKAEEARQVANREHWAARREQFKQIEELEQEVQRVKDGWGKAQKDRDEARAELASLKAQPPQEVGDIIEYINQHKEDWRLEIVSIDTYRRVLDTYLTEIVHKLEALKPKKHVITVEEYDHGKFSAEFEASAVHMPSKEAAIGFIVDEFADKLGIIIEEAS